jgi:hypothetical protein
VRKSHWLPRHARQGLPVNSFRKNLLATSAAACSNALRSSPPPASGRPAVQFDRNSSRRSLDFLIEPPSPAIFGLPDRREEPRQPAWRRNSLVAFRLCGWSASAKGVTRIRCTADVELSLRDRHSIAAQARAAAALVAYHLARGRGATGLTTARRFVGAQSFDRSRRRPMPEGSNDVLPHVLQRLKERRGWLTCIARDHVRPGSSNRG